MLPPCPHRPLPSRPLFGCRAPPSCPSRGGGASNCAKSIPAEYPRPPGAQKAARRLRFAGAAIRIIYKYKYDNNTRFYAAAAPYRRGQGSTQQGRFRINAAARRKAAAAHPRPAKAPPAPLAGATLSIAARPSRARSLSSPPRPGRFHTEAAARREAAAGRPRLAIAPPAPLAGATLPFTARSCRARSLSSPPRPTRFFAKRAAGRPATSIPHSAAPCRGRGGKGRKAGLPAAALVISGCPRGGQKAAGGRAAAVRAAVSPARFPPQSPIFSAIFEGNRPILAKS